VFVESRSSMRKKRAVLIGICEYSSIGEGWNNLPGCINDVECMKDLLQELGFNYQDIVVLKNEGATHDAIIAALTKLIEETQEDDLAVFHYSGHGNQIDNSQKSNGFNETIVPFDNNQILDDEIKDLFSKAKSSNFTLVFDCCHSGDITREPPILGDNQKPVLEVFRYRHPNNSGNKIRGKQWQQNIDPNEQPVSYGFRKDTTRYVLLAGCREKEIAREFTATDEKKYGYFTYALCDVLHDFIKPLNSVINSTKQINEEDIKELKAKRLMGLNWLELFPKIKTRMIELNPQKRPVQTPQLIGLRSWRVFGFTPKPVPLFFPALVQSMQPKCADANGDRVYEARLKIQAGYLHGIKANYKWRLETIMPNSNKIYGVENYESTELKITEQDFSVDDLKSDECSLAVHISYKGDISPFSENDTLKALVVESGLSPSSGQSMDSTDSSTKIPNVQAVKNTSIEILKVYDLEGYQIITDIEKQEIYLTDSQGTRLISSTYTNRLQFIKNIKIFARCTHILEYPLKKLLDDSRVANSLLNSLKLELRVCSKHHKTGKLGNDRRSFALKPKTFTTNSPIEVFENDTYEIKVANSFSDNATEIYVTIIEFDADCGIYVLHPERGSESCPLRPGCRIELGDLDATEGITIVNGALPNKEGCYMEILRFVIATRPIDFCFLEQFGLDDPREVDLEYLHSRNFPKVNKASVTNFQLIDVWVKIKPN
jgi:hypothetical protein